MSDAELWENDDATHESESSTWIALADLMTGLMAIFLVMFLIIMTQQGRTRVVIIQSIEKALQEKNIAAKVDAKTGDISVTDSVLFAQNQAILTPEGKQMLQQFIPQYSDALYQLSEEQQKQIARIVVEGHTSREGTYGHNMTLSLNRANAVVQFVNEMPEFASKQAFLEKLTPVGRGFIDADLQEAKNEDRKVMFRFQFHSELHKQLAGDEMLDKLSSFSNESQKLP